jgi:hypothetical protein
MTLTGGTAAGTLTSPSPMSKESTRDRPLRARPGTGIAAFVVALMLAAGAAAAPADDRVLPPSQYISPKAKELATRYASALRALSAEVYHCLPWVEVSKQSVGFFKPKNASEDDRYLSIRIYIEQESSPQFAQLGLEQQASAMFSRYVGPLLQRMARNPALLNDDKIRGFNVILEWTKQTPQRAGGRPVHETIAVFVEKPDVMAYLGGTIRGHELADKTRILAWDGEQSLGPLQLSAWDDNFVATYKVQNYQLDPGVTCP